MPKHAGGKRKITVPAHSLKGVQRMLLAKAFSAVELDSAATAFRPGTSTVANALPPSAS